MISLLVGRNVAGWLILLVLVVKAVSMMVLALCAASLLVLCQLARLAKPEKENESVRSASRRH
jgi:hypothetical protein